MDEWLFLHTLFYLKMHSAVPNSELRGAHQLSEGACSLCRKNRVQTFQRFLLWSHKISNNDGSTAISLKVNVNAYIQMIKGAGSMESDQAQAVRLMNFLYQIIMWVSFNANLQLWTSTMLQVISVKYIQLHAPLIGQVKLMLCCNSPVL